MPTSVLNPYERLDGAWLRGSFHGHSAFASRCASVRLSSAVRRYRRLGAAFTAFTNHDVVTRLDRVRARNPGMVFLEGFEHSRGENLVFVGERVPPLHELPLHEAVTRADGLLTIVCHPRPRLGEEHWTAAMVRSLPRTPVGVEVYNGHYGVPRMRAKGCNPLYSDFWDELLTSGLKLWGFANDDSHDPADFGNAWNMVNAGEACAAEILRSARAGRFYGTTGLMPAELRGEGELISVGFDSPCRGRFVGPGGRVLASGTERSFRYRLGPETYARFEAEGADGRLFLQPVYRTGT